MREWLGLWLLTFALRLLELEVISLEEYTKMKLITRYFGHTDGESFKGRDMVLVDNDEVAQLEAENEVTRRICKYYGYTDTMIDALKEGTDDLP
jgi:hypothetical protein